MSEIIVEHHPTADRLGRLDVYAWPIWEKEVSRFSWSYDESEICLFLEGDVKVTPNGGTPVRIGKGDLVTFPANMECVWDVRSPVRKHYRFG